MHIRRERTLPPAGWPAGSPRTLGRQAALSERRSLQDYGCRFSGRPVCPTRDRPCTTIEAARDRVRTQLGRFGCSLRGECRLRRCRLLSACHRRRWPTWRGVVVCGNCRGRLVGSTSLIRGGDDGTA